MDVTQVATELDGALKGPLSRWWITSPVPGAPRPVFRHLLYLRFSTGGLADKLKVNEQGTIFQGKFDTYEYDALSPADPSLAARMTTSAHLLITEWDLPQQVGRILLPAKQEGYSLELCRLDGHTPAEKATVTVPLTNGVAALSPPSDFTDTRLALRLTKDGAPETLRSSDISQLLLRSYPTSPRLGIADPADLSKVSFFWQAVGEIGKAAPADLGEVKAGEDLAQALQRHLDSLTAWQANLTKSGEYLVATLEKPRRLRRISLRTGTALEAGCFLELYRLAGGVPVAGPAATGKIENGAATFMEEFSEKKFAISLKGPLGQTLLLNPEDIAELCGPLPLRLDVALVIESDSPCTLDITSCKVAYHLVQASFPTYAEKNILRFDGNRVFYQDISLQLSRDSHIISAVLTMDESFGPNRAVSDNGENLGETPLPQKTGVYLGEERWAAQETTPPQALAATGVALGVVALAENTEIKVELHEDWRGQPSGKKLAEGSISIPRTGTGEWGTLLFPDAVLLSHQPYWLLVKAAHGYAIWLTEPGAVPVRVLEKSSRSEAWSEISALTSQEAKHTFFHRNYRTQGESPLTVSINGFGPSDPKIFNLVEALQNYLISPHAFTDLVTIPLRFTSRVPGILTLYPPVIEYEL